MRVEHTSLLKEGFQYWIQYGIHPSLPRSQTESPKYYKFCSLCNILKVSHPGCRIFQKSKNPFVDINIFCLIRYFFADIRNNIKNLHLYFQGKELRLLRCKGTLGTSSQPLLTTTIWGRTNAIIIIFQMKSSCLEIVISLLKSTHLRACFGI